MLGDKAMYMTLKYFAKKLFVLSIVSSVTSSFSFLKEDLLFLGCLDQFLVSHGRSSFCTVLF